MFRYFISIGAPNLSHTLQNKVMVHCANDQDARQCAKLLRKQEAEDFNIKPSRLTWAIYHNAEDTAPAFCSDNWHTSRMSQKI